jgi:hypothetical protein
MKELILTPKNGPLGASGCRGEPQPAPCCCPGDAPASPKGQAAPCCAAPPPASRDIAGYAVMPCVTGWIETQGRSIPRVSTRLALADRLGGLGVRLGIGRGGYRVAPGLYAVGEPDSESPILVTANYKLTFDALRRELDGVNAWILVLDTRGVNVWCAAGKKTFSTAELIRSVRAVDLAHFTPKRELIVPQLGAPGVSAFEVKRQTGFRVVFGPVLASDLKRFLENGKKADPDMRRVPFGLAARLAVTPVELVATWRTSAYAAAACLLLGGLGPDVFSFARLAAKGGYAFLAYAAGFCAGNFLFPALLPVLPGRSFALKGALCGAAAAAAWAIALAGTLPATDLAAHMLAICAAASWFAVNFTGSTTFTSPSGVDKEMRRAIPAQAAALAAALALWIAPRFWGN